MMLSKFKAALSRRRGTSLLHVDTTADCATLYPPVPCSPQKRYAKSQNSGTCTPKQAKRKLRSDLQSQQDSLVFKSTICIDDFSRLATTVRQILFHPTLGKRFREFAAARHADEGIRFIDDIGGLVVIMQNDADKVEIQAAQLMDKFFVEGAPYSVNLPGETGLELKRRFDERDYVGLTLLFEDAMYEIFSDMKQSDIFRDFCAQDLDAKTMAEDTDILLLNVWVAPENFHAAGMVLLHEPQLLNLLRFCCSVVEFERSQRKSQVRTALGNKILANFVQAGSRFQVQGLAQLYCDAILKGEYEHVLADARLEFLQVLSLHQPLIEEARRLNAQQ